MNRASLEHILRAAAAITDERDIVAGRQKDLDFVRLLLRESMVAADTLAARVEALPLPPDRLDLTRNRFRGLQTGL